MRRLGLCCALAVALLALAPIAQADTVHLPLVSRHTHTAPTLRGTVTHVCDADTVDIALDCCPCVSRVRVRLLGVDAPERGACMWAEGRDAMRHWTQGHAAILEQDATEYDGYNRLLGWLWVDGALVNARVILEGYAVTDIRPPDDRHGPRLLSAESDAQAHGRGGWAACEVWPPVD